MIKSITAQEVYHHQDKYLIIDVREQGEYVAASIEGAILLPLGEISASKIPETSKTIVVHCRSGKRSEMAILRLLKEDPSLQLLNMIGGILSWQAHGYPTAKGKKQPFSLTRQTHIIVGCLSLVGITLSQTISPIFLKLSAFISCGLIFSGLTGFCSLSYLLAKMPWNNSH
ncbi:MAG TPA: rhodanese-like domain-containing protein [Alphaproteobacteria bacterium]|nr:rhodanese-like domain-containing protein [Alphaproteobacteria bacterium]